MKKKNKIILSCAMFALLASGVSACGGNTGPVTPPKAQFNYGAEFKSGTDRYLYMKGNTGIVDQLLVNEYNKEEGTTYNYSVTLLYDEELYPPETDPVSDYIEISNIKTDEKGKKYFDVTPKKVTDKKVIKEGVEEIVSRPIGIGVNYKKRQVLKQVEIANQASNAQDGYNWAGDGPTRQKVLGKLEEYAMNHFLTGIALFENGAKVSYSNRAYEAIPASEYITGYGWGLLADGKFAKDAYLPGIPATDVASHPTFYQTASSSDPLSINAWDATGSQISDLNSYITTSYWGTKLKGTDDYEWYPILAQDGVERPIPIDTATGEPVVNPDKSTLYSRYRIPVKTGLNGLKYHYGGKLTSLKDGTSFEGRLVELEDYITVYQALLTNKSDVSRGSELAGDTSYGIKGGAEYYRNSKGSATANDGLWNKMMSDGDLGLDYGPKNKEDRTATNTYIEIELINPIDQFTAMYTLSSNLYSPMPRDFLDTVGHDRDPENGDYATGTKNFGTFPDGTNTDIKDYFLCIGPFMCIEWAKNSVISFARQKDWFEYKEDPVSHESIGRYHIDGVRIRTISGATEDPTAVWKEYSIGKKLDSAGIPSSIIATKEYPSELTKDNGGDSTFKLNVNSCTQEEWNNYFGPNGKVNPQKESAKYDCKPWMSNQNFLEGIYWSINRPQFAQAHGVNPSYNYFSGAYMADPESRKSYNSTPEHMDAVKNFHNINSSTGKDDYGYDPDTAVDRFTKAVNELVEGGKITKGTNINPTWITIHIKWMYESDITEYGDYIKGYIESAFNNDNVCGGVVKLNVTQDAVADWQDVYNKYLMKGQYDLGFGAISGNTYNPLNFMEVLKSDNSSGFTLCFGDDTSKVDAKNPIRFSPDPTTIPEVNWSFDGLWAAADHGAVITQGRDLSPVENGYMANNSSTVDELYNGGGFDIFFDFVHVDNAALDIIKFQLQLVGCPAITINPEKHTYIEEGVERTYYTVLFSQTEGTNYNQLIVDANELEREAQKHPEEEFDILHPFTKGKYGKTWFIVVKYSLQITGSTFVAQNEFVVFSSKQAQDDARK